MKNNKDIRLLAKNVYTSNKSRLTRLNNNDLIIGPSGSGKTRGYVMPNIMACNHSFIVSDPKGKLCKTLGPGLRKKGFDIIEIDFCDLENSACGYNPFDFIKEKENGYNEQDIGKFIETVFEKNEVNNDRFWDNAAKQYLSLLCSYMLTALPRHRHSFYTISKLLKNLDDGSFARMIERLRLKDPENMAVVKYDMVKTSMESEKTTASIKAIVSEKLEAYSFKEFRSFAKKQKRIDFEKLSRVKSAVFLKISETDRSMDKILNSFFAQALNVLCETADKSINSRLRIPVRIFLDDFASNFTIANFDKIISIIRSREIYVSIILQSLSQLNAMYGDYKAATIINNCDQRIYLGGQDMDTTRLMAERLNLMPNTVMNMPLDKVYVCQRGKEPIFADKFDISMIKELDL